MWQILFQYQGDFGFYFGLQYVVKWYFGVVVVVYVGKQGVEVWLIDVQLLLYFGMGQVYFVVYYLLVMGYVVLDVQMLDGIGGVGIVDVENIMQWGDCLVVLFCVVQLLGQCVKRKSYYLFFKFV